MELLTNTNFIVLLSFVIFFGILYRAGVPAMLTGALDARAEKIAADLAEARRLRDEAAALLASYEKKQAEVARLSDEIVTRAREEAAIAAAAGERDLALSVARRLKAAEDQIASAEASAVKQVRDEAITVAIAVAGEVMARKLSESGSAALMDRAIAETGTKLH